MTHPILDPAPFEILNIIASLLSGAESDKVQAMQAVWITAQAKGWSWSADDRALTNGKRLWLVESAGFIERVNEEIL